MHRRALLLFILLGLLTSFSASQVEEPHWLSVTRLSVSVAGTYFYRPWNRFNESLEITQETVNADPTFQSPSGSAEKILGNLSGQVLLRYRIAGGISAFISGSTTATSSRSSLLQGETSRIQSYRFKMMGYGGGAEYCSGIGDNFSITARLGLERLDAILDVDYSLDFVGFGESWEARLRDATLGLRAAVMLSARVHRHLNLSCGFEYRQASFANLCGLGSYKQWNGSDPPYRTTLDYILVERHGYFGIDSKPISNLNRLGWLAVRVPAEYWFGPRPNPTTLELSAFGIQAGVSFEF